MSSFLIWLSICLVVVWLFVYLCVCLFVYFLVCVFVCILLCWSVCVFVSMFTCLFNWSFVMFVTFICLPACLFICLFICVLSLYEEMTGWLFVVGFLFIGWFCFCGLLNTLFCLCSCCYLCYRWLAFLFNVKCFACLFPAEKRVSGFFVLRFVVFGIAMF